jgi:hypothetical protein
MSPKMQKALDVYNAEKRKDPTITITEAMRKASLTPGVYYRALKHLKEGKAKRKSQKTTAIVPFETFQVPNIPIRDRNEDNELVAVVVGNRKTVSSIISELFR